MPEILLIVVLLAVGAAAWWWLGRRRRQLLGGGPDADRRASDAPPEVLSRDALLRGPRSFDPGAWDDSEDSRPEPASTAPTAAAPGRLDRDSLTNRQPPATRATPPAPTGVSPAAGEGSHVLDRDFLERRTKPSAVDPTAPIWDDEGAGGD